MTTMARSFLFVPGDRPDRFPKAWNSGAHAVILDMEDGVSAERKTVAREAISAWLSPEHPVYVRVNGSRTQWFEADLTLVARSGVRGVMLPKAETADQIGAVAKVLQGTAGVVPLLETVLGIINARELAGAPRVERLAFGSVDFQLDSGIQGEGEELLYARSWLVLASRVSGILAPVDGVTTDLDNPEQIIADVDRARRLGFGGKLCVHPRQIGPVNSGFAPSEREIAWARKVVEAAAAAGTGAIRVDGELVDRPVVERAKATLAQTEK
ncbi:MAG: HpcH/HpaI aldolase/citrate lyase family protein [Desulfobacteria bacterium]